MLALYYAPGCRVRPAPVVASYSCAAVPHQGGGAVLAAKFTQALNLFAWRDPNVAHWPSRQALSPILAQGRPDVLALMITHLVAESDVRQPLQLITALLRHQKVEALCVLCREVAREGHVAHVATLFAEAAR